tara:strand:+ start:148 stop:375 length:228 start_codon:yes stop_codon:yes gene_type:complete
MKQYGCINSTLTLDGDILFEKGKMYEGYLDKGIYFMYRDDKFINRIIESDFNMFFIDIQVFRDIQIDKILNDIDR